MEFGPRDVANLFSVCEVSGDYCIGRFSDEAPEFREDIDVDDECEDFVRVVPEHCRYLLRGSLLENFGYLDVLCDGYCSNVVYLFYSKCDERTEQDNSTQLDFLCANNNDDKRCGDEVISEFSSGNPLDACMDFNGTCSLECIRMVSSIFKPQWDVACIHSTH